MFKRKKVYKVEIEYIEDGDNRSMKKKVNGKPSDLPPRLLQWIANDYVRNLMMKDEMRWREQTEE